MLRVRFVPAVAVVVAFLSIVLHAQAPEQAPSTTAVTADKTSVPARQPVLLTGTVAGTDFGVPTGQVAFSDGAISLGAANLAVRRSTLALKQPAETFPLGVSSPTSAAVADFNGDGFPDTAVATLGALTILNGSARNPFTPGTSVATFISDPVFGQIDVFLQNLVVGDFDHDGRPDIAGVSVVPADPNTESSERTVDVRILLNKTTGFTTEHLADLCAGTTCQEWLAAGDFNGDGVDDIAISTPGDSDPDHPARIRVTQTPVPGPGDVMAEQTIFLPQGFVPGPVITGRFHNNANADLVVVSHKSVNSANQQIFLYSFNGADFVAKNDQGVSLVSTSDANGNAALAVTDVNRDGNLDLLVARASPGSLRVLLGDGQGGLTLQPEIPLTTEAATLFLAAEDLNADGLDDVAVLAAEQGAVFILTNDSQGRLTLDPKPLPAISVDSNGALGGADFNRDGFGDLAVYGDSDGAVPFFFATGEAEATLSAPSLAFGTHHIVASFPGDLNFAASTGAVDVAVTQIPVTIKWQPNPDVKLSDVAALGPDQLNATAVDPSGQPVPGTFVYEPPAGTVLQPGQQTLRLTFTPTSTDFQTASGQTTIQVVHAQQSATVTFTGPNSSLPGTQPSLQLLVSSPIALTGKVTLTYNPIVAGATDRAIRFLEGGQSLVLGPIKAGETLTKEIPIQVGTLAGTVILDLTLTDSDRRDVAPSSNSRVTITVPPSPPDLRATKSINGNTLQIDVEGYSDTREITSASFHFTAASGATLNGGDITIPGAQLFDPYYQGPTSSNEGGKFHYMQLFTVTGNTADISSVTVTLTNSIGVSNSQPAQ